jgi:hypothetical protein
MKRKKCLPDAAAETRSVSVQRIGLDGWPVESDEVDSIRAENPAEALSRFYRERMRECERAVRAGNLPAAVDAMMWCGKSEMPPPLWLEHFFAQLVERYMSVPQGRGRYNTRWAKWTENKKHFARWEADTELRDYEFYKGSRDKSSFKQQSAAKYYKTSKRAINESCRLVEKRMADGGGAEFYPTHFQPKKISTVKSHI